MSMLVKFLILQFLTGSIVSTITYMPSLASSKNMTRTKTNNKKEKGETVREDDSFTCQQSLGAKMEKRKSKR